MMPNKTENNRTNARRIGVTGGVGSGKSTVLQYMESEYGALILRTDDLAREMMEPGGACYEEVMELFGRDVLQEDGTFDRAGIAARVFDDPELLERLNSITHPAVIRQITETVEKAELQGIKIICLESALFLDEQGRKKGNESYDELWYVYADEGVRRERLKASRGYSEEKISAIIANQVSEEMLRKNCDAVIDNSGEFSLTEKQIDRLLEGS